MKSKGKQKQWKSHPTDTLALSVSAGGLGNVGTECDTLPSVSIVPARYLEVLAAQGLCGLTARTQAQLKTFLTFEHCYVGRGFEPFWRCAIL